MGKKLVVLLSFFVITFNPVFAYAQDATTATTTVADTSVTTAPTSDTTTTNTSVKARPLAGVRDDIKTARTELKDKVTQAREDFKTKLAAIKDAKKQEIVNRIDTRISDINKNRTDQMTERLSRLTDILGRISTKEATLKSEGKNTSTLDSDIAAAQKAIDAAKTAVSTQAAKVYTINITTETALRSAVSTTIQQFTTDIKAVHAKVVAAQQSVVKSFKDVGLLMGGTPTPSGTTTTPTTTP